MKPIRNKQYIFFVSLRSQASPAIAQVNPTLATGDVTVAKDGATAANLGTLPTVTPSGGKRVKVTLSAAEMAADNVTVVFSDAAGDEWADLTINIQPQLEMVLLTTTIATLSSQTSFTLTAGATENDPYNGCKVIIYDSATGDQVAMGMISDYVGSTKTVTLREDPAIFTMATGDHVVILPPDILAIGKKHGGSETLLELSTATSTPALQVNSSGGDAVKLESTGGNGHGATIIGNGSGDGLHAQGGATAHGIQAQGGATSGNGILAEAQGGGYGLRIDGVGASGYGLYVKASGTGTPSVFLESTSGEAIQMSVATGQALIEFIVNSVIVSSINSDGDYTGISGAGIFITRGTFSGTPTTTSLTTDLTETTDDHYKDSFLVPISGSLKAQGQRITAYNGTSKVLTTEAFTDAPVASDKFIIIGKIPN